MHRLILNVKLLSLVAAVVVAVVAAGSLGAPREAQAQAATDPTGVICGYLHNLSGAPNFSGTTLARIEPAGGGTFDLTAVAYTHLTSTAMPDCKTSQIQVTEFPAGFTPPTGGEVRPSVTGLTFSAPVLSGGSCQEAFTFGGVTFVDWTRITVALTIEKAPTQSTGSFSFETEFADETTCINAAPQAPAVSVDFDALYQDGPGGDPSTFTSDWDKDGITDWNELNPNNLSCADPFETENCGVGGVAELADVATTPLEAADSSSNTGLIAVLVAVAAAAAVALGAGAVYARSRLTR